ncbi:hypothetical protein EDD18DRAFT_1349569 [Armillaria luteobubalina]|uniref:Uncharacterized protein n=1 Tax=Armillaria luteobubalina TaxID=153913 RepID=A0AA39QAR5_9AGAR|nr:hypothetical protein EDD18DRAFT_1349569 [Armillaria luteobubalina]
MAEEAGNFYDRLQDDETFLEMTEKEQSQTINKVLKDFTAEPSPDDVNLLAEILEYESILKALETAAKGKAAGINGLPYELWLLLWNRWTKDDDSEELPVCTS